MLTISIGHKESLTGCSVLMSQHMYPDIAGEFVWKVLSGLTCVF